MLGLYADAGGEPGALLGRGHVDAPAPGAGTRSRSRPGVPLVAGTRYWLGLLNPPDSTGTLRWRDRAGGRRRRSGPAQSTTLTALPATWVTAGRYSDGPCPAAWGRPAAPAGPPSLALAPASLALRRDQGGRRRPQTLAVTNAGDGALDLHRRRRRGVAVGAPAQRQRARDARP